MVPKSANLEHYWLSCDTFVNVAKMAMAKTVAKSGSCKIKVAVAVAGWQWGLREFFRGFRMVLKSAKLKYNWPSYGEHKWQ
jgi:hypothetical protein